MIRVTVELRSAYGRAYDKILGFADIANDGTGTVELGNYDVLLNSSHGQGPAIRTGRVQSFQRIRFGCWELLLLAIGMTLGPERIQALGSSTWKRPTPRQDIETIVMSEGLVRDILRDAEAERLKCGGDFAVGYGILRQRLEAAFGKA